MLESLTITEIYASIQGESSYAGFPCTFIRLTGCPLRCKWCDTAYAFDGGKPMSFAAIHAEVDRLGVNMVELTGGEPLAQPGTKALIASLIARGHQVLIETGGSESIEGLDPKTHIIMDIKCPGSGMAERNLLGNLQHLKPTDEIKFVMMHRADFDWTMELIRQEKLDERFQLLFSCAWGHLSPKDLAAWMVEAKTSARLQLQQHKYIWGPRAKGV
jgi:7-carboxy-7-deazaguanine synthase